MKKIDIILNDEAHHIFNASAEKGSKRSNLKKWKEFLINPKFGFKYMLGFTGTAYIENEYFNDVIYRYSLKKAIDEKIVKSVEYVQKDDVGFNRNYKFQKIRENHAGKEPKAMSESHSRKPSGSVMIVGGGIAGMQSALDLANSGYYVHLVEKSSAIGGIMSELDKTFPTNDCAM